MPPPTTLTPTFHTSILNIVNHPNFLHFQVMLKSVDSERYPTSLWNPRGCRVWGHRNVVQTVEVHLQVYPNNSALAYTQ